MSINEVLNILLPLVFILVGVALIVFLIELVKVMRNANGMLTDMKTQLNPMMSNVEQITAKANPLMDRVQLTVDSLNLEMMRVDQILEDVSQITDSASSATAAVDNITNAPLKAVNNVASRMRSAFGSKDASAESERLAEQRAAVAKALEDYQAAEAKGRDEVAGKIEEAAPRPFPMDASPAADDVHATPEPKQASGIDDGSPVPGAEPVIDPDAIKDSAFFVTRDAE